MPNFSVSRKAPRQLWFWGFALAVAITLATVSSIRNFEKIRNEASFQAAAVERIDRLTGGVANAMSGLVALGAYFDAAPDLDRGEFFRLTQPFLLTGSPIQALEWVPRVPGKRKSRFVQAARRDGNEQFEVTERTSNGLMVPVATRPEYFPVFYIAPVQGNEKAIGFDLASNPARVAALERAYTTGMTTATARITLVQERSDQYGFLAFRPVFRGGPPPKDPAQRREALAGFVLGAFRIGDIVSGAERAAPTSGVAITLTDEDAEPGPQHLYPKPTASETPPPQSTPFPVEGLAQRKSFRVAGRTWSVVARPTHGAFVADHMVSDCVLAIGCLISALWALYLRRLLQRQYVSDRAAEQHFSELQQERNFNAAILSAAGALIVVCDRDARIVRFNRAAEDFTGRKFAQVKGQPFFWDRFRRPEERGAPSGAYEQFRAGGQPNRFERIWQNGSGEPRRFDWTVSTISDEGGDLQYLIALGLDITAQKRLEETARNQESRLRTILENLAEGVCTLDAQGQVTYLNARAQELLGWSLPELVGRGMMSVICDPSEAKPKPITQSPIYQAMQKKAIYRSNDEEFFCKDGSKLPVKLSSAPLLLGDSIAGLVVMFSDARAERLLQQRLVEAKEAAEEAARLKAEFLSTMSHEIRTPLNGVIGMTDILLDTELDTEQIEFVRIIKTSADALNGTIDDILDFSKIEAGRLELEQIEFSLQQVIESSVDIVALRAQEKKLTLASYIDPALPDHFIGDPLRIRQVLLNFLSNAVKFSDKGQILVSGMSAGPTVEPGSNGACVRLGVRDNGIGISPEAMERLFQPFSQADSSTSRKYGGTGLGLVICKRLVEAMGGKIGVDSEAGRGATFWMVLPLSSAQRTSDTAPKPACDQRVLIAGDNPQNRALWRRYVESWRMRCEVCDSLNTVQDQVTRLLAAGERIDAVLLAEPLADSGILEAAMALRPKLDAIVCCLDEAHKNVATESRAELKTGLSALGVSVIQKPMKQSALLDALMLAWSKCCEPASRAPATAVAGAPTRFFHRSPRRLLLAEDNAVNQRVAFVVLEKLGYAVDVVDNGTEAIQRAVAGNYAAALMDCQMPETDGFQATQAIRRAEMQTGRRLPIIAMTANALDGDRERCIAAGMDDYIPKPIDAEALKEVLMRWTADSSIDAMPSAQNPASHPSSDAVELAPAVELGRLIDIFGDDRGTIVELLTLFRSSIEQTRIALDHELTTRGAKVKNLAHEIKGMSANMGAERLSAMAAHLEDNADNGDWEAIERLGRSIEHEVPRILAFIDAFVQTGKPLDSGAASPSGQEAQELR